MQVEAIAKFLSSNDFLLCSKTLHTVQPFTSPFTQNIRKLFCTLFSSNTCWQIFKSGNKDVSLHDISKVNCNDWCKKQNKTNKKKTQGTTTIGQNFRKAAEIGKSCKVVKNLLWLNLRALVRSHRYKILEGLFITDHNTSHNCQTVETTVG